MWRPPLPYESRFRNSGFALGSLLGQQHPTTLVPGYLPSRENMQNVITQM